MSGRAAAEVAAQAEARAQAPPEPEELADAERLRHLLNIQLEDTALARRGGPRWSSIEEREAHL